MVPREAPLSQAYARTLPESARTAAAADPRDHLIVALDFPSSPQALALVERLGERCRWVKVGMELFYAEGAALVRELRGRGLQVFLDLKLHDIPHTVAMAVRSVQGLGVQLLTVHASGGPAMLREAAVAANGAPALLGVTVLTSMDEAQLASTGVDGGAELQVQRLARLALEAGLEGVVCSPRECGLVRAALGEDALLVVPGVRPEGAAQDDQRRVATPAQAMREGASLLVVGRPISRAADPAQATEAILADIASGLEQRAADGAGAASGRAPSR